jgi:hypothetical protein
MEGQRGSSFWAANQGGGHTFSVTKQVDNEDIFAEIAITGIQVLGEEIHSSNAYISQCVSDSGVENFDSWISRGTIFRTNVTSITFLIDVFQCWTKARWMINYWS